MPGIVGIASRYIEHKSQEFEQMISAINHKPAQYMMDKYTTSFCKIARVHLGKFNRKPQPIFDESHSKCLFFEGAIFSPPLCNDLASFWSLYEESGRRIERFIECLNGSFVIVVLDFEKRCLLIANDRFGLRPIYYSIFGHDLYFASEAKAIWKVAPEQRIDDGAIVEFLSFGKLLGEKTFFKDIRVLPPASVLSFNGEEVSLNRYWDFNYQPNYEISTKEFTHELVDAFKRSLEIRMCSNYRYGVSLSGGLDSRAVVAGIKKIKKEASTSLFTFGPLQCDEVKIASKVAQKSGMPLVRVPITPSMIIEYAQDEVFLTDGQDYIGVSYIIPVHRAISDKIDIVFDGFALDLILGGSRLSNEIISTQNSCLFDLLYRRTRLFTECELKRLFRETFHDIVCECPYESFKKAFEETVQEHPGNHCDHFYLKHHVRRGTLMGHVLLRSAVDNAVPTYDYDFIDIILQIPPEKRVNHGIYRQFLNVLSPTLAKIPYNKTMVRADAPFVFWQIGSKLLHYREAFKRELSCLFSNKIVFANKRSYVDFDGWLRTEQSWKTYFHDLLLSDNSRSVAYFKPEYVKELIETHGKTRARFGRRNNSMFLLYLATVEWFLRLFGN